MRAGFNKGLFAARNKMKNDKEKKEYIIGNIKAVYKVALDSIELRFGRDFEGFKELRARILRTGNDAIRKIEAVFDEKDDSKEE